MSVRSVEPTRGVDRHQRKTKRPVEVWERERAARLHVGSLLHGLPPGFLVFNDVQLPRPTRAVVEHLVIGPRNVWAVTTVIVEDAVELGSGRNADTLWSGHKPLRSMLEAADWESSTVSGLLGFDVEPVICLVAPSLPAPAFDFHGIRICEPGAIVNQVARSTADFVDVATVADAIRRTFGAESATEVSAPTLGTPLPSSRSAATQQRVRRTLGARIHRIRSTRAVRVGTLIALAALLLALLPTIVGTWNSVASEGAERISDVIDERSAANENDVDQIGDPPAVRYRLTCPEPGAGWVITWRWPGRLPDGVAGYSIRTRTHDAPPIMHTLLPWSDPASPPSTARVSDLGATTILTDYRAAGGDVLGSTAESITAPTDTC